MNSWTGPGYRASVPRRDPAQQRIIAMLITVAARPKSRSLG